MSNQFDIAAFQQQLSTQWLGHSFSYREELESTNSFVKSLSQEKLNHGLLCLTDNQTRGRGQYERKWESEPGLNLTFSLVFRPQTTERFHVLTLALALAIAEYINSVSKNSKATIKWPNDVMIDDKKIAGLLTETMFSGNTLDRLVIGIGLNVNQQKFSSIVEGKATSLELEQVNFDNRETLLCQLLKRMEHKFSLWHRQQQDLVKDINRNIIGYGHWVGLKINGIEQEETYKLLGINEQGQLLMLNHDGGIASFSYEQIRLITD